MEKKTVTRQELEAYRAGWDAAKAIEREEAERATIEARWQELNAIFNFGYELGWIQPASDQELEPIRERWARLKAAYV